MTPRRLLLAALLILLIAMLRCGVSAGVGPGSGAAPKETATAAATPDPAAQTGADPWADLTKLKQKVARAAMLLAEAGREGLDEISDPEGPWAAQPYVYAISFDGVMLAHPREPNLVGKKTLGLRDIKGTAMTRITIELARDQGRGWLEYWWPRTPDGAYEHKITYVLRVPGRQWLVAGGLWSDLSPRDAGALVGD